MYLYPLRLAYKKSLYVLFVEKTAVLKILMGKFFKLNIIVLKHVLYHSKSISTQKLFFIFLSIFWSFFAILGPKSQFLIGGIEIFLAHFKRVVLWSFRVIV